MRTGGQEKRRTGMGQALPPAPLGNALCHLIEHPSCCPTSAPLSSSLCFLPQDEHMNREEREEMRKIEAENKEKKERWEDGTTPAFEVQQKDLGVASFLCRELQLRMPGKVRYRFKPGTRHQSTGLERATFKLTTLIGTQEP